MNGDHQVQELFPLPCSAFERYMLADDRPSHPMGAFMEFDLSGHLDAERLQAALKEVIRRHPLLNATVNSLVSRPTWRVSSGVPELTLVTDSQQRLLEEEHRDLTRDSGFRAWLCTQGDRSTLTIHVHHACADALGMMTFVFEWLALATGRQLPDENIAALRDREDLGNFKSSYSRWRRLQVIGGVLLGGAPEPLRVPTNPEAETPPQPGCCGVRLDCQEFRQLKERAKEFSVSINDWLVAALFLAIDAWNSEGLPTSSRRADAIGSRLRVIIPVNRRERHEVYATAMNKIGYKLLNRTMTSRTVFEDLLRGIGEEMDVVRGNPQGVHSFLKVLQLSDRMGVLPWLVRSRTCMASIVFSNLGDVSRTFTSLLENDQGRLSTGDVVVEGIRSAPPRRPGTHATVAVFGYAGELHLFSRGDGRGLSHPDTHAFLELYRRTIIETLAPPRG